MHKCVCMCVSLSAQEHTTARRLDAEAASRCRPCSPPDPDPLSRPQLVTPSLIAAQHTEAICSAEACRHGDAGRLYGFVVN